MQGGKILLFEGFRCNLGGFRTTRIKILTALSSGELCVCDISKIIGMTMSAVSHQLKILKTAKLVGFRKEGKTVFYSLADSHVMTILKQGLDHINE